MDPVIKQMWTDALRSDEYDQGVGYLRKGDKYCCLGVLCKIAAKHNIVIESSSVVDRTFKYGSEATSLPNEVVDWAELDAHSPDTDAGNLIGLNDSGVSFSEIADLIDRDL